MVDRCRSFGKFERSLVPHRYIPLGCHIALQRLRLPTLSYTPLRRSTRLRLQCHVHLTLRYVHRHTLCTPPYAPPRRAIRSHPNPDQAIRSHPHPDQAIRSHPHPEQAIRSHPHPNPEQAGDQISTVRTSAQCWCDDKDDCLANPAVRALTDRMLNVTRLPYNNAEYFQILQYE